MKQNESEVVVAQLYKIFNVIKSCARQQYREKQQLPPFRGKCFFFSFFFYLYKMWRVCRGRGWVYLLTRRKMEFLRTRNYSEREREKEPAQRCAQGQKQGAKLRERSLEKYKNGIHPRAHAHTLVPDCVYMILYILQTCVYVCAAASSKSFALSPSCPGNICDFHFIQRNFKSPRVYTLK